MFVTSLFLNLTCKLNLVIYVAVPPSLLKNHRIKGSFAMGKVKMQILSSRVNAGEIRCGLRLQKKVLNLINFMFHLSVIMRV